MGCEESAERASHTPNALPSMASLNTKTPHKHHPTNPTNPTNPHPHPNPQELAEFIVAGRLGAKIDKVAGVVESKRPDARNAAYQDVIRKGDLLLNRIQKLSRIIDIE